MKKLLVISFVILCSNGIISQTSKLYLTPQGVESFLSEVKSLTKKDLYEKSLNWTKERYLSPNDVIKATIKNEKIRINGFSTPILWYKLFGEEFFL